MTGFPVGKYFFIKSLKNDSVLDIYDGETTAGAKLIIWPQKETGNDNQLWRYDNGFLTNKNSTMGNLKSDTQIVQYDRKTTTTYNQRWGYRDGFVYVLADPRLVLDIKGDNDKEGTSVILYARKDKDNENQQWRIVLAE
ncbi:hypothetical protein DFQ30_003331 [Apophysomyces sp. BC1015]|nr:hypothetical protein DFQ30_003331 [Apophysomyces sp. BC1015]